MFTRSFRLSWLLTLLSAGILSAAESSTDPLQTDDAVRRDAIVVRSLERMEGYDYRQHPAVVQAVTRHIERAAGTPDYLKLVKQFNPPGCETGLETLMLATNSDSDSVEALDLLLASDDGVATVLKHVDIPDAATSPTGEPIIAPATAQSIRVINLLGYLGNQRSLRLLRAVLTNASASYDHRAAAVRGLVRNNLGTDLLLKLAESDELAGDVRLLAGGLLTASGDQAIRERAAAALPMPQRADREPLPPLDQLAAMSGDVEHGSTLFRGVATCSNCHIVDGFGKQVGPDLSEIGTKLSREAMFTSILDPSAGISHNYENHIALLTSGQVVAGVLVSQTGDAVTLRTAEAIDMTFPQEEIEELQKSKKSIMPENLHHTTDQQGLVDLVEYLMTLKKKG